MLSWEKRRLGVLDHSIKLLNPFPPGRPASPFYVMMTTILEKVTLDSESSAMTLRPGGKEESTQFWQCYFVDTCLIYLEGIVVARFPFESAAIHELPEILVRDMET